MLTQDLLLAIIHGLPSHLLSNLDLPYVRFCRRLDGNLHKGLAPAEALKAALRELDPYDARQVLHALRQVRAVQALPGLTPRQQQLLLALRLSGPSTCGALSRALSLDRSHTRRRLQALVASGWVGRLEQWGSVVYFAQVSEKEAKSILPEQVEQFNNALEELATTPAPSAPNASHAPLAHPLPPKSNNFSPKDRHVYSAADVLTSRPPDVETSDVTTN